MSVGKLQTEFRIENAFHFSTGITQQQDKRITKYRANPVQNSMRI